MSIFSKYIKITFDKAVASALLILLSPVLLVLALFVKLNLGSPILFVDRRPGFNGLPFMMYKFRTMREEFDESGERLSDSLRLTEFGKFLRKFSLDELPELWNVLKGEMSLVGPRPLLMEYLALYDSLQARRHEVRPGITGWAQVNGRNAISWDEKFKLDVWYVDHQSLWLDMKILILTIVKVFKREGITQVGHVTTSRYTGTSDNNKEK
jgi:sugar transferase EpsL